MDGHAWIDVGDHREAAAPLIRQVVRAIETAERDDTPFLHLRLDHFFPDAMYGAMLDAMPATAAYRRMSGRSKGNDLPDGTPTRVKIDLFGEYIRHLPRDQRSVWSVVGRVLRSPEVQAAFVERLAPTLERRFGPRFAQVRMYPIPILTHDMPGYRIAPHTDTHWKGITVQLYLPADKSTSHVGTIFHQRLPDGSLVKSTQMKFAPNAGYAFAVGPDTWHSADTVGSDVPVRDSILLTYFVDSGLFRMVRNRAKRFGNFVLNELRRGRGR